MSRNRKILVGVIVLLVLVVVVVAAMAGSGRDAVSVRAEEVQRRDLVSMVRASGWIRPRRSVDVQADIMGRVTELNVQEGDPVTRGQVLLRIDPSQYEAAVARARATVSQARAQEAQARASMIQARQALARAREMIARDSSLVSPQALEEAETQARVQEALHEAAVYGVEQAQAGLREARDRLEKTVIRAPIDGMITRLNVEEGETAIVGTMNNPGSLLLAISDLSVIEAVIRVDETDIPSIAPGDSAVITIDAFPRAKFTGRVTEIAHSSVISPENRNLGGSQTSAVDFEVVLTLDDPPASLRPDLSATAEVVTDIRDDALAIPIIALTVRERRDIEPLPQESPEARAAADRLTEDEEGDVEGVFIVRDGRARFVPVQVGITGQEHFEVTEGLAEGDTVVAGPYEAIRSLTNDQAIRIMNPSGGDRAGGQGGEG